MTKTFRYILMTGITDTFTTPDTLEECERFFQIIEDGENTSLGSRTPKGAGVREGS